MELEQHRYDVVEYSLPYYPPHSKFDFEEWVHFNKAMVTLILNALPQDISPKEAERLGFVRI